MTPVQKALQDIRSHGQKLPRTQYHDARSHRRAERGGFIARGSIHYLTGDHGDWLEELHHLRPDPTNTEQTFDHGRRSHVSRIRDLRTCGSSSSSTLR